MMSKQVWEATEFTEVRLDGIGHVDIIQGAEEGVVVDAPERLLPKIDVSVEGKSLVLGHRGGFGLAANVGVFGVRVDDIRFTVTVREIESLVIGGSGSMQAERVTAKGLSTSIEGSGRIRLGTVEAAGMEIGIGGSGRIHLASLQAPKCVAEISGSGKIEVEQLAGEALAVSLSGSGRITMAGTTQHAGLRLEGSGQIIADELQTQKTAISITGSGRTKVWATDELDATIEGSGRVGYRGSPKVRTQISHSGKVVALDK